MGFTFGQNWTDFSRGLDEERLREAEQSLHALIGAGGLRGRTFVDVGAGSGLFSIAAMRSGVSALVALDRDPQCLSAMRENAARFLAPDEASRMEFRQADVLKPDTLGDRQFDIVYAWGSLHHTGAMWQAITNASRLCRDGGVFVIAIYNRTVTSPFWLATKRLYHAVPRPVELAMAGGLAAARSGVRVLSGKHPMQTERGMNVWHDAIDWLGGLPYEYASAEEVVDRLDRLGFTKLRATLTRRLGCNEFAFEKRTEAGGVRTGR